MALLSIVGAPLGLVLTHLETSLGVVTLILALIVKHCGGKKKASMSTSMSELAHIPVLEKRYPCTK